MIERPKFSLSVMFDLKSAEEVWNKFQRSMKVKRFAKIELHCSKCKIFYKSWS